MSEKQASNVTYIIAVIVIFILLIFSSCKTKTLYVPVETIKTEYKDKLVRDSIYAHDSIFVKMKGDTIWFEKYKYLYRDKIIRDSVFIQDSIQVPYPVEIVKEVNHLKTWQIILMCLGGVLIGYLSFRIYRFFS